jgi:hypothetical protein
MKKIYSLISFTPYPWRWRFRKLFLLMRGLGFDYHRTANGKEDAVGKKYNPA